jgi:hypothetical protein
MQDSCCDRSRCRKLQGSRIVSIPEKRLPGCGNQHRQCKFLQFTQPRQDFKVLIATLPEPDPRIDDHSVAGHTASRRAMNSGF